MAPWNDVPVDTYLKTRYRPDCDYLEGTLKGRNACLLPHSAAVGLLCMPLHTGAEAAGMFSALSLRVRINETRYRIADLCVVLKGGYDEQAASAPALCVEILSPEQTLDDMVDRVADYLVIGVPDIWVVDPVRQQAWTVSGGSLHLQQKSLAALEGKLHVSLAELYHDLEQDWPLEGAEQLIIETVNMLEVERRNRPEGWFFSEENQDIYA